MMRAPIIYSGQRDTGLLTGNLDEWGPMGHITALTIHHSAAPRAATKARAIELHQQFNALHAREFGGKGIGYHFSMDDQGRIYRLRPVDCRGSHVGGHNTGNVGLVVHGNYEVDKLTAMQRDTLKWLCSGGFSYLTGASEKDCILRMHFEWSGPTNQTACPGKNIKRHVKWRRLVSWR